MHKLQHEEENTCPEFQNLKCSICIELPVEPLKLNPCSHKFCASCIRPYLRLKNNCPLCRGFVGVSRLDRIYQK